MNKLILIMIFLVTLSGCAGLGAMGRDLQQKQTVNCNSFTYGNSTQTNCY